MFEHTDQYISKCVDLGILSLSPYREYPLRPLNLAVVLKAYALTSALPYDFNHMKLQEIEHHVYYLTDAGLEWLYRTLGSWSLNFLRSNFSQIFAKATEDDLKSLDKYQGLANFRGTVGIRPKAGSKQSAVIVHRQGNRIRKYNFNALRDAREELVRLSRFYPISEFKLYRRSNQGALIEVPTVLKTRDSSYSINNLRKDK